MVSWQETLKILISKKSKDIWIIFTRTVFKYGDGNQNRMEQLRFIVYILFVSCLVFIGCGITEKHNIIIPENIDYPQPLIEPLPLKVGVYYSDDFRKFETVDKQKYDLGLNLILNIQWGKANIALFDYILPSIFKEIIPVQKLPEDVEHIANIDTIIEPSVQNYSIYTLTGSTDVLITYEIKFYLPNGEPIGSWTISSRGSGYNIFSIKKSTKEATKIAMREVAVIFMTDFCNQAYIKKFFYNQCTQ